MTKSSLTSHNLLLFHMLIFPLHLLDAESLFFLYSHNICHNERHTVNPQWVLVDWFTAIGSTIPLSPLSTVFHFLSAPPDHGDDWLPRILCLWGCSMMTFYRLPLCLSAQRDRNKFKNQWNQIYFFPCIILDLCIWQANFKEVWNTNPVRTVISVSTSLIRQN